MEHDWFQWTQVSGAWLISVDRNRMMRSMTGIRWRQNDLSYLPEIESQYFYYYRSQSVTSRASHQNDYCDNSHESLLWPMSRCRASTGCLLTLFEWLDFRLKKLTQVHSSSLSPARVAWNYRGRYSGPYLISIITDWSKLDHRSLAW